MYDYLPSWFSHWLPLAQGFAALASIAGAALSWRYALKAQRAREEMIQNVTKARLLATLEKVTSELQKFRTTAILDDGQVDQTAYQMQSQRHKQLLEEAIAQATVAFSNLKVRPDFWKETLLKLAEAADTPDDMKLQSACAYLAIMNAQLKLEAATRELAPST
jgi:hypothetical protein